MLATPTILIIYNRPDLAEQVFARIRAAQPKHLFVIADGPRKDRPNDDTLCQMTRDVVQVDWDCDLHLEYSVENMGCQQRIYSGLNRAFELYPQAIILEDDCLPDPSFFGFCEFMLNRYADDEAVMHISGSNFASPKKFEHSYAFTQYPTPWGWATWRRAWNRQDLKMVEFFKAPEIYRKQLGISDKAFSKLMKRLRKVYTGEVDSWAYPWLATTIASNGRCLTPKANLIGNIGFDERSTHTANSDSFFANNATEHFDLEQCDHPESVKVSAQVNKEVFSLFFGGKYRKTSLWGKLRRLIQR